MSMTIRKEGDLKECLKTLIENAQKMSVQVGWVERKQYPDSEMTTAEAAYINELGSPAHNIPPRPFMRPTFAKKQNEWKSIMRNEASKMIRGKSTIERALEIVGLQAAGDIRETITNIWSPGLSMATIRARLARRSNKHHVGNLTKPLVDTGYMLNSLTHKVVQGDVK
jgi:hypothetical protein